MPVRWSCDASRAWISDISSHAFGSWHPFWSGRRFPSSGRAGRRTRRRPRLPNSDRLARQRDVIHFVALHLDEPPRAPLVRGVDDALLRARDEVPPDVAHAVEDGAAEEDDAARHLGAQGPGAAV